MVMLVSLQQASDHVRRDTSDDDADLTMKVEAASAAVIKYLGDGASILGLESDGELPEDSSGPDYSVVPRDIQIAVLLLTGIFYRDREGQDTARWEPGYLPAPVISLLYGYRAPAVV